MTTSSAASAKSQHPDIQQLSESAAQGNSNVYAGVARSLTRAVGLYFSRPVRLFRPVKVSGWTTLRGSARRDGASLTPGYVSTLIRQEGWLVIPRHFIPPLAINTLLGTLLFTTYSTSYAYLTEVFPDHSSTLLASVAGAASGAVQSVAGAPAENVRLILEGGIHGNQQAGHAGWRQAWKEVFLGTESFRPHLSHKEARREARAVRLWMKEVTGMAGRGWDGWAWGCGKDVLGFSLFFAVFDISRRTALHVRSTVEERQRSLHPELMRELDRQHKSTSAMRVAHGLTLVSGGVIAGVGYELIGRPFDVMKQLVYRNDVHRRTSTDPPVPHSRFILEKLRERGMLYFFRAPQSAVSDPTPDSNVLSRRCFAVLRTLARVGPWGVGFLVWEAIGGELQ